MLKNIEEMTFIEIKKLVCNLKSDLIKAANDKEVLKEQLIERESFVDEALEEIYVKEEENHKLTIENRNLVIEKHRLERENDGYKEYYRVIALNEDVYNKYMAMFNTAKSRKQQNRQAVRELLQAIDTYGLKTKDDEKFKKGAIDNFVENLKGQCKMFTEEQCMILLNR